MSTSTSTSIVIKDGKKVTTKTVTTTGLGFSRIILACQKKWTPRLKYKCLDSQILMGRKKLRLLWKRRRMLLIMGTRCSKIGSGESCLENDKENMDGHNSQGGERNRTFKWQRREEGRAENKGRLYFFPFSFTHFKLVTSTINTVSQ